MLESISKWKLLKWAVLTSLAPMAFATLVATLYITAWYAKGRMSGTPHVKPPPIEVRDKGMVLGIVAGEWAVVMLWRFFFRRTTSFGRLFQVNTDSPFRDIGMGFVLAGALIPLIVAIGPPTVPDWPNLYIIPISLTAGFCEEFLFRGFLMFMIDRAGLRWKWKLLWSAAAFGLAHVYQGGSGMAWATFVGALFALLTLWRRNVWAAVTAHSLVDLSVFLFLGSKSH